MRLTPDRGAPAESGDLPSPDAPLQAARVGSLQWLPASGRLRLSSVSCELLGLGAAPPPRSLDEFIGALVCEEDRAGHRDVLEDAVRSRRPYCSEYRVVRPVDGRIAWIEERGGVGDGAGGAPLVQALQWQSLVGERLEREHRRLAECLREADARKDEFLTMLAHELRNPLAPIRHAARALQRIGAAEPLVVQIATMVGRQAEHMAALVSDLLDVGRITRGTIDVDCEPVDLVAVVRDAVEQVQPLVDARGHALEVRLAPAPLMVLGDHVRLVQIVVNLLSNAAKYTPDRGRVHVSAGLEAGDAVVRVRDNGLGIEPALLPSIFEAFTQSVRTIDRTQGGLGLGLSIARGLVDMQGGVIEAASDGVGRGSCFTMRLPALAQESAPAGTPASC